MTKKRDDEAQDIREDEQKAARGGRVRLLVAGLIGSIAGAAVGLLLAPWRGAEARRKLKEAAATAGASAREKAEAAREKAGEVLRRRKCAKEGDEAEED